ncbi:MAG: helix-turn-helix transcriptional regulator [Rickettsiales bacterium]|jgi:transcriptional regulator with XRE-family HTH domain|nr:helix-turn-helix transcriptional regulator [Rickettsiales bacterium]
MTITPIDKRIGSKLKARRNYLGITQSSLGSMLGVTFQQVQKYEKGINRISISKLKELSKILRVPVEHFLDDNDIIMDTLKDNDSNGKFLEDFPVEAKTSDQKNIIANLNTVSEKELLTLVKYFRKIDNRKVRADTLNLIRSLAIGGSRRKAAN